MKPASRLLRPRTATATIAESAISGFNSDIWFARLAPAGTRAPIVAKLNRAVNEVLALPDVVATLREMGGDPMGGTPERALQVMRDDQAKWLEVMKDAGIKPA